MDKILFLGHQQVSSAFDTFFDGCIQIFGCSNIFEYPILDKYHTIPDFDISKLHTDIQPVYGWWCKNIIPTSLELPMSEWAIKINNLELKYIVGTNRAINNFTELLFLINKETLPNICIIFIEEEEDHGFENHRNLIEKLKLVYDKIDIHYRVDYTYSKICSYKKIMPFYMSCPEKILLEVDKLKPFEEREFDICFLTESNHKDRIDYFDLIKNIEGNNLIICGKHNLSLKDYFSAINNSKIFISVRGNGWSNTRNVEGPRLGAALFADELEITIPFNYIENESAIFFNRKTLVPRLLEYLNDNNRLKILAQKSYEHCLSYHTTRQRAAQMIAAAKIIKCW